jgi:two-component system sensor histidine kinase DegS
MNAIQKGKAQKVCVFLNGGRKNIKVRIIDDGVGFDVDKAVEIAKKRGSFGLINMEERTRIAGGTIRIDSSQGKGTHIYLDIPVPKEDLF